MADTSAPKPRFPSVKLDKVWIAIGVILGLVALLDWPQFPATLDFAVRAFLNTLPFILFAVLAVAYLKATGAENLLAKAFEGKETRMIVMAALFGGLSPFCSCEVIPFIAALLAVGAPLSAVMAFWLASPLMDPAMFAITSGALGYEFAIGKAAVAICLGMFGGFGVKFFAKSAVFADPLREKPQTGGCCGVKKPFSDKPVWAFWHDQGRITTFRSTALTNFAFLAKWLALAYTIEALMVAYLPADLIANVLGGSGAGPIFLGAIVGMPAYLNGYAAVELISGL